MDKKILLSLVIGGLIRLFLMSSKNSSKYIQNRVEISTPINSWKRVKEGVHIYRIGDNPYAGDIFHDNPIILVLSNIVLKHSILVPHIFILLDLLSSILLYLMSLTVIRKMLSEQKSSSTKLAKNVDQLLLQDSDTSKIPFHVMLAFLFNPYSILNCVGQTTTVFSNFLLALFFFCLSRKYRIVACLALALETQQNLYPFVLVLPAAIQFSENSKLKKFDFFYTIILFVGAILGINYLCFRIIGNWSYLNATIGFIFNYRDLQPNIGLFWYFFTEMFDHFRTLFLYTFQINATLLYLVPLTLKLQKNPVMLATMLISLSAVFRSYPCVGDIAFYMALLPLWKCVAKFMSHNFIVGTTIIVTTVLAPVLWHLWIYSNSANANFYFGVTLIFSTAQIFLITDLFFAYIKREFCLVNGLKFKLDGQEAKMALE